MLTETFDNPSLDPNLQWHCEPSTWALDSGRSCLRLETDAETDFWQRTHYGFQADNGHFLYLPVKGDFVLQTQTAPMPANQYDQAGLMVRVSPDCWIKTSVEYEPDGPDRLGAVVTDHGYSDWSTQDVHGVREVHFRIRREGADYIVEASFNGHEWTQLRVTHLDHAPDAEVLCGLYACSPKGAGFVVEFGHLTVGAPHS